MEWLVYCIVLAIGFHSKPTKWLLPPYYVVPQVLDSIRYRLVHEIGLFRFVASSFRNGVVGVLHSFSHWISLQTNQMTPPPYYVVPQVLDLIRYRLVHETGLFRFVGSSFWNGVVGVLNSLSHWISLNTNQITPPTILCCSPCFGLNPISIGPRNRIFQVRGKFVQRWSSWCIA